MRVYILILAAYCSSLLQAAAVTYEVSPGRFGDNLLCYIHAKWIAYTYSIPILYKPFIYSDQLRLDTCEIHFTPEKEKQYEKVKWIRGRGKPLSIDPGSSTLYVIPYFPDSAWEQENCISFRGGKWDYFCVDWEDQGFVKELNRFIVPRYDLEKFRIFSDRITVAVHVRRGGNHDTLCTIPIFPLKFLSDDFFIDAIKKLYSFFNNEPLYVYIFTDDNQPYEIVARYKLALNDYNIQWGCREVGNTDTSFVLEDFFSMKEFDCLIHSESNYSYILSKLNSYFISLYPTHFEDVKGQRVYTDIRVLHNPLHSSISLKKYCKNVASLRFFN